MGNIDATEAIQQLLNLWPKDEHEPVDVIRTRLQGRVNGSLHLPSLRTVAAGDWRLACSPLVSSGVAKCFGVGWGSCIPS